VASTRILPTQNNKQHITTTPCGKVRKVNIQTERVEPYFVTVADAALILGLDREDIAELIEPASGGSPTIAWVEQFGRVSIVLASLRDYAEALIEQAQTA
jgi:hypothetical protein